MKIVIVGTGLSAATFYHLLKTNGYNNIEIFETRNHIGGNCYDGYKNGIMVHQYGPHTFHTDDIDVWNFVNSFDKFNNFRLIVKARIANNEIIDIPFNLNSADIVGDWDKETIKKQLFRAYSEKHWGILFHKLPKSIIDRVPIKRKNRIEYYHSDKYSGIPINGYTKLITNMFHGAKIHFNCHINDWKKTKADLVYYTGSIDEYYNYSYGLLTYRSLDINFACVPKTKFVQLNECNFVHKNIRQVDHSYWYNQQKPYTIVTKEYPKEFFPNKHGRQRFYPKIFESQTLYNKYKSIPNTKTIFGGRLGTYKYLDMDDCIKQSVLLFKKFMSKRK